MLIIILEKATVETAVSEKPETPVGKHLIY